MRARDGGERTSVKEREASRLKKAGSGGSDAVAVQRAGIWWMQLNPNQEGTARPQASTDAGVVPLGTAVEGGAGGGGRTDRGWGEKLSGSREQKAVAGQESCRGRAAAARTHSAERATQSVQITRARPIRSYPGSRTCQKQRANQRVESKGEAAFECWDATAATNRQ